MMVNSTTVPIGVFDSGVGGLSVLKEIHHLMPNESLLYVADSGFAPYGNKSRTYIVDRSEHIVRFFLSQQVKAIVVACNTATSVAVDQLRSWCPVPIIAMEPAIKPAALHTTSGVVAVLATSQTIGSDNVNRLIAEHGQDITVLLQACTGFVELVESGDLSSEAAMHLVESHVKPLCQQQVDTLVLGCTHYPFLRQLIASAAGSHVTIIDPSSAIAKQLQRRLREQSAENMLKKNSAGMIKFYTSGDSKSSETIIGQLWGDAVTVEALALHA